MASSSKRQEIWLYLQFPLLSLETLLPQLTPEQQSKPIAVIGHQKNVQQVLCCNSQASAWGVEKQLSLSTALALCPELLTLSRRAEQEQERLQQLALLAYSFSPEVIIHKELGLWLEISGCDRLFKGYDALLCELQNKLQQQGITAVNGLAENPLAARLLCKPSFQTHLPSSQQIQQSLQGTALYKLETSRKQQQSFKQLGLTSLADLLALPRSALSERFDAELMATIQQLNNQRPFTATRFQPPSSFYDLIHNPQGIFNKESLLFPMKTLLQRLCQYMIARQCHCLEMHWRFEPLIGESKQMSIRLSSSQNSWSMLLNLSRLQLERQELPRSIEQIILYADQFIEAPAGMFNLDLFGEQTDNRSSSDLIDSLNARLGAEALFQPVLKQENLPEQAGTLGLANQQTTTATQVDVSYGKQTPQPLWLLDKPVPVQIRNQQLYWHRPLKLISGPQRLCGNWWQNEQQRDYYLACDSKGARYWLFREAMDRRWFIHGLFA
jgi:protein ImuB